MSRRDKLMKKLLSNITGEDEATLMKLTVERICADMCDFYKKFYSNEGPGAMVYAPEAMDEKKTMFYLTVDHLANAIDDFNSRDMEELSTVMHKAVARAEALEPEKEALFIIHDNERMSLVHYKLDSEGANFIQM